MKITDALIVLAVLTGPVQAADAGKDVDYAKLVAAMAYISFACDGYTPSVEDMNAIGKDYVGAERADQIRREVGAEITAVLRRGGMDLKAPDAALLNDTAVHDAVADTLKGFSALDALEKGLGCRKIGGMLVDRGLAKRE